MGAEVFSELVKGINSTDAFDIAVKQAKYDYGEVKNLGTIANKSEFVMLGTAKTVDEAEIMADDFIAEGDERVCNKLGPAGCISIEGTNLYFFFGVVSN